MGLLYYVVSKSTTNAISLGKWESTQVPSGTYPSVGALFSALEEHRQNAVGHGAWDPSRDAGWLTELVANIWQHLGLQDLKVVTGFDSKSEYPTHRIVASVYGNDTDIGALLADQLTCE